MKFFVPLFLILIVLFAVFLFRINDFKGVSYTYYAEPKTRFWKIQSIDTMKYSRDLAREKLNDKNFYKAIDYQIENIAGTGATHVAIGTPYDEEFVPMLRLWVDSARSHGLKVWFRGNWSGWDKWFDYPAITRIEHIDKTRNFILGNSDLFEDGDLFSSCPECENGGPGDPRITGDVSGHRNFIVSEYRAAKDAFKAIGKDVGANYFSMNGDVARLVMDKKTTADLGGIVTIDHYVKDPKKLKKDIEEIASISGGKIVLGEFGVSVPDIHGEMTEREKALWMKEALSSLEEFGVLVGVNYWVSVGGSTGLWSKEGKESFALKVLKSFYKPELVYGIISDELGDPVPNAKIYYSGKSVLSGKDGYFKMIFVPDSRSFLRISAFGYVEKEAPISISDKQVNVVLDKEERNIIFKIRKFLRNY